MSRKTTAGMNIFHELPSGIVVKPRIIHTILTGITQHGKTEVIKSLIPFYHSEGYTVLIIDVKDKTLGKPDFADYPQIPIYLEEVTDPLSLLGLLESNAKMKLKFQFPELIKACQRSSTLRGIRDELDAVITGGKIHPVRKDKAEVLKLVLDNLIEEIDRIDKSETLQIKKGQINCMNLSNQGFSDAFKQIAVRSVIRFVRMNLSKIFVIFDEAHIQVPEGYSSASKQWIVKTIKEGASSKQFLLIADQTIKEVDKNVVAQCHFKIFGGQAGGQLEAKRTYDYMPVKSGVTMQSIMRLGLGHFYLCTRDWTKLCYALPRGVPEEIGVKVAKGSLTAEYVRDKFMVKIEKEDDEMVYKEKFENLEKEHKALLENFQRTNEVTRKFEKKLGEAEDMVKALRKQNEEMREANLDKYHLELEKTKKQLAKSDELVSKLQHTDKELEALKTFKAALRTLFPLPEKFSEEYAKQRQKIILGASLTEITVEDKAPKEITMTTEKATGKLMFCALKLYGEKLENSEDPVFTSAELQKRAREYGWNIGNKALGGSMMVMVREGQLIQEGKKYRLPSKLKIKVTEKGGDRS